MPYSNFKEIGLELIQKFGTTYVNGQEVIQKGELIYDLRRENEIGMIIIK
jgi:hypothetical protein